ncbi:MAG: hypothetical protein ABSG15_08855 [FCB group bacterium]|jgi:predicted nucleic acid-binding protein
MPRKLKIYLDTSVINFIYADDAPEKKDVTLDFFNNYLNEYDVFISSIVYDEIDNTRSEIKKLLLYEAIKRYNLKTFNEINNEIVKIAQIYIDKNIIPVSKFEDAMHIAFATFYEFDILLSWNFKHLANINKQVLVNAINTSIGYNKPLLLFNPMEVIYEK